MKKIWNFVTKALRVFGADEAILTAILTKLGAKGVVALVNRSDTDLDNAALRRFCTAVLKELEGA